MILDLLQTFLALAVVFLIIIQRRGTEGGVLFGQPTQIFFKRRGLEERIFYLTWLFIFLFIFVSFIKLVK